MNFKSPDDCVTLVEDSIREQKRIMVLVARDRFHLVGHTLLPLLNKHPDVCGFVINDFSNHYHFRNGSSVFVVSDNLPKSKLQGLGENMKITVGDVKCL